MPSIRKQAHVEWSAEQMYALVNDIEAYPEFLSWCTGARIVSEDQRQQTAELDIGFAGIRQSFSTINTLEPPNRIALRLHKGPFRSLEGAWTFTDTHSGCVISLALDFAVSLGPLGLLLSGAFEEIVRSQMDAFVARAGSVYG